MNNNIIAPTFVNGVTIVAMAAIGFTLLALVAQLFHLGINIGNGSNA